MNTSHLNLFFRGSLAVTLLAGLLGGCGGAIPTPASNTATTTTVTLQGQLTDAVSGQPIAGAKIEIGVRSATTDANGHYELTNVPANSGSTVSRDYQATLTLTGVTSPINMTNAATSPRYPDRKFAMPITPAAGAAAANHDFKVGKLSATISGVVGDSNFLPVGSASIELQDNTPGMVGTLIRTSTSNASTGAYSFVNVEAGMDYKLVGRSSDGLKRGNVTTGKLADNQLLSLTLGAPAALLLSGADSYSPRIILVSPDNNADIAPGAVNVVLTFNEPIKQDAYSIPNASVPNNIYHDINVSYGGQKAAGNFAHTLSWNATFDVLTINLPSTGVSSKFTVDLSLLSPTATALGKLKDNAGNGLENSPVLTAGNLLAFTTNGGAVAIAPVILSPNAAGLDSNATSVTLDWLPATGATKGYNIYRSIKTSLAPGIAQPFVLFTGPIAASSYIDTTLNLLPTADAAQSYAYRVTSINSDLIESAPSNELLISDVVAPTVVGTAGVCVAPGGTSMTITSPVTTTTNGQVKFTFSEALAVTAAETLANYTGVNISAAKLTTPTTVVLDFSAPITCVNTNTV
ncbi:MAG: carboxypeptidase-like regulatory domain-containing protein, partial [Gallionella sp.]